VRMTGWAGRGPARLSLLGRAWPRPTLLLLLIASAVSAQTLQQAETLWKARRFKDANDVFLALADKYPENPDIKVRWGRLFLERNQPEDANAEFDQALEIKKDHAGALLGLALLAAETYDGGAADLARKALEIDPKLVEAQELLARLALEDNNNPKAIEDANKALALDPNSVQAKAILATIDWLADKKDSKWDPQAAKGYETAGHFFTLNRRYEESDQYYIKALQMDPQLDSARAALGINLMRMGNKDEAYLLLKTCWDNGYQSHQISNSLKLMDSYTRFVTFKTDRTTLVLDKKEADLLHPYFESEMQRAIATYEKKYKFKLDRPVQVEVYPDHEDFAVRTLGMPGLGALGVTFGYSVAMDSPSGRKPGDFHWASTMWHEMSHVFTLTMSNHRVPRWFTEGLAVHEETAVSPEWGDRLGPDELAAIKDHKLLPVAELDRGFIHPKSNSQVVVSYFQAGRICDYINKKWGWDTLLAMLKDFGSDDDTPTVIKKELKIEPQEFDKEFLASIEAETKTMVTHFDDWKKGVKQISESLKNKDYDDVIKVGTAIRDYYPEYVEEHSVYEMLSQAYIAKGDKPAAIAELERYVKAGGRNPDGIQQAAKLLQEAGNGKEAAAVLERLNYIYPMVNAAHQSLGDLWFAQGNAPGAVREYGAIVAHNPVDPAKAHYDLARAYHLNHQDEQSKDELVASLEIAPGYRQAQKLLLELSESGTQHDTVKK
jgi:tetratricopeptide (TPR) repeat protein